VTFCDAHNHLHFPPFAADLHAVVAAMRDAGISHCVANGTSEHDWPAVANLARAFPDFVLPAFGLHPWNLADRSPRWLQVLTTYLADFPNASIGECGLDRAMENPDLTIQNEVFRAQLELARTRGISVSVHCVKAWGPLLETLRSACLPARGLLLHDFTGTPELVTELLPFPLAFSFSATALLPARAKLRAAFARVPAQRLLLETDAPNNPAAAGIRSHLLAASPNTNHPANLPAVAARLAPLRNLQTHELAALTQANFQQWFSPD